MMMRSSNYWQRKEPLAAWRAGVIIGILLAIIFLLSGCKSFFSSSTERSVPVIVYCNPPLVEEPVYPIDALPENADIFQIVRALWATVEIHEAYAIKLRAALDKCSEKATDGKSRI